MNTENTREYITILDFASGKVFIRVVPEDMKGKDAEEVCERFALFLGVRTSDCSYMISSDDEFLDLDSSISNK